MTQIALRDYQHAALDAVEQAEARGVRRQLVVLPVGSGKTVVFAELIRRRGGRALVVAHREELITQAVDKLRLVADRDDIGVVQGDRDQIAAPILVGSVQTLARANRMARLPRDVRTVVVDEAHHVPASSYQRILRYMRVGELDGPLAVGVTATPERADGQPLAGWEIVCRRELLEMIVAGYLCDLRAKQVQLEGADFSRLHVRAGDVIDREAEEILLAANAPEHAAAAYLEHAASRRALLFAPTVAVTHAMVQAFARAGVVAEAIDGSTPRELRRAALERFQSGRTAVIANCAVLTEGFDEPRIDCVIIARPTLSRSLYVQMLGRGTRTYPGKGDCLILDLVGSTSRHNLQTAATVLGVKRHEALAERGVLAALQEEREEESRGRLVAQTVELFRRRPLHWITAGAGRFVLPLGRGTLLLEQQGERWRAIVREPGGPRVLVSDLPLGLAFGSAEDYARQVGAMKLVDPAASWRAAPASDRQLAALRRCRIRVTPAGLTKGEASDLLAVEFAGLEAGAQR